MQEYKTINNEYTCEIEEKKSKFIANIAFADTEEKAINFLNKIRSIHKTATHNVYAYKLRENNLARYSDDGEPQKTAGLPILEVINHSNITDLIIVVTRYFGGTLLGTGGLVRAYTSSAQLALKGAEVVTVSVCVEISLSLDYKHHDSAVKIINDCGGKNISVSYNENIQLSFVMLDNTQQPCIDKLCELTHGGSQIKCSEPYFDKF